MLSPCGQSRRGARAWPSLSRIAMSISTDISHRSQHSRHARVVFKGRSSEVAEPGSLPLPIAAAREVLAIRVKAKPMLGCNSGNISPT
jgi:hypothetical protein